MPQKLLQFLILFLLGTTIAKSQPVITAAGVNPQFGDNSFYNYVISSISNPDAGGPQANWDYSNLPLVLFSDTIRFTLTTGMPYSNIFPYSNIVGVSLNNTYYQYLETNNDKISISGIYSNYSGSPITVSYTPSLPLMKFPMFYGKTYTDTILETDDSVLYDTIFCTSSVDGFGTLKLPNATYTDVLRLKQTEMIAPIDSLTPISFSTKYLFIKNGIHGQLLELDSTDGTGWQAGYLSDFILPIEITSFKATWQNKMPFLQWTALNTQNTQAFNVQRSVDGINFSTIAQVNANAGASYNYQDPNAPNNTVYYRLQHIGKDGQTFYSTTVQLTGSSKQYVVFPNPAKEAVQVAIPSGNPVQLYVYSEAGKLIYHNINYTTTTLIATSAWSKGNYVLRIKDSDGWKTIQFEKQ